MSRGRVLACFVALAVLGGGLLAAREAYARLTRIETLDLVSPIPLCRAARDIYPFSIVPGGVYDSRELADSVIRDPVAREHYQDLLPERFWPTQTSEPMLAYVSYRKAGAVNWTNHPVLIPAGEVVLTDGTHLLRARCGNRISRRRPSVALAKDPPPDLAMEARVPGVVRTSFSPRSAAEKHQYNPWLVSAVPAVPEPGTLVLLAAGLGTLVAAKLKRR
jgi:hypothetical protein